MSNKSFKYTVYLLSLHHFYIDMEIKLLEKE